MKIVFSLSFLAAILALSNGTMPFKDQCIYWHNYFRTLHQVPNVTWSMSLQKEAEDWVKYLADNNKFHHSSKNPGNLYLSVYRPREYCSDAIWWFHWEEKYYNYSNPKYYKAAGHFTQVLWKNSKQIGAAWAIRKDGRLVISIKYNPGGNYIGFFGKNVKRPTAQLLGPEWPYRPSKRFRCPADAVLTPKPTTIPTTEPTTTPPTTTPTTKPTTKPDSGGTMPFIHQCIYWHNYFRTLHQVPFVTWSLSLQKEAQDWVKYLAENNTSEYNKSNSGNLYISTKIPREYCSEAVWWLHSQEKYYNFSNPRYVKAARNFTQMVWKNVDHIGAAWSISKDNKLIVAIKYSPERSNEDGNFEENVLPPTAATLGPEWLLNPPVYARCPRENILTQPTEVTTIPTKPHVKGTARKTGSSVELFISSVILAALLS
ncbi:hypothetical protein ACROYT_G006200 [Oculina patagonica]